MHRTPPHREINDEHIPLAYLVTFRTYGSWLHGDNRGSVDRTHNKFGTPRLRPNPLRENYERQLLKRPPVILTKPRRDAVERGIRDTCRIRKWRLWALNVRTNHIHTVVSADCNSKKVRATLKANATRSMRESGCWKSESTPWAEKGSRRFLWTEKDLLDAINYVLYDQGDPLD